MVEKESKGGFKYSALSPDEAALVLGAKEAGVVFYERSSSMITIKINGNITE
jgi:hypothetical protein